MDTQKSLQDYLNELSSNSPTPGGGNVSAVCGVLASSLGAMICNLTIGKKKYRDFEPEAIILLTKFEKLKKEFLDLATEDNLSFDKVMDAFKLPKDTEIQMSVRQDAINKATLTATAVPSEVIIKCRELLPLLVSMAEKGNQNSLSDTGVAISLVSTAARGAFLNVTTNCSGLLNQVTALEFLKKSEYIFEEIKEKSELIISTIFKKLNNR
jgi:glutamate formiminotransferase/formiminotetrahydrofolate cyclodeaminase